MTREMRQIIVQLNGSICTTNFITKHDAGDATENRAIKQLHDCTKSFVTENDAGNATENRAIQKRILHNVKLLRKMMQEMRRVIVQLNKSFRKQIPLLLFAGENAGHATDNRAF